VWGGSAQLNIAYSTVRCLATLTATRSTSTTLGTSTIGSRVPGRGSFPAPLSIMDVPSRLGGTTDWRAVISVERWEWLPVFTGLSVRQFGKLVGIVRRRGGEQAGRRWRLALADRVLLVAVYYRTNLMLRETALPSRFRPILLTKPQVRGLREVGEVHYSAPPRA